MVEEKENAGLLNNFLKNFVKIKNKWSEINSGRSKCCENNCINAKKPIGNCIKGNGFVNIINDEDIKYINSLNRKRGRLGQDHFVRVHAENSFKNPHSCFNYSLYYFEVKCIFESHKSAVGMGIGFKNCNTNKIVMLYPKFETIENEKNEVFKLSSFSWEDFDIFGCGLVYPPTNMTNKFPYIFTQNGKQIG
uniref:Uncharacterized protein n=1 Tax=Meloidogyne enterolobii TaxID=390850 RepID=A0A6V7VCK5_MELEN|nr:unnamed protein product [Meloidogyne enterolobii]